MCTKLTVFLIVFAGVTVSVSLVQCVLNVGVAVPPEFQTSNYTIRGLFGDNDGNPTNDFILPDGTVLSNTMTDREIFSYGENCKISVFCMDYTRRDR